VRAMVDIGRGMKKKTIAEFVESQEVLEAVRSLGIHYAQGYCHGEPQALRELADHHA